MVINPKTVNRNVPLLSELVNAAYDKTQSVVFDGEVWTLEHISIENFQVALCSSSSGRQAIAFPGTNETADWFDNVNFIPKKRWGSHWHGGFFRGAELLWFNGVMKFLKKTHGPLLLSGHSLGGPLAGIVSAFVAQWGYAERVEYIVTWASPRFTFGPGSKYLKRVYGDRAVRIVAGFDVVPHLVIPGIIRLRFRHTWDLIHIGTDGVLRDSYGLLVRLSELASAFVESGWQFLEHHFFVKYLKWSRSLEVTDNGK